MKRIEILPCNPLYPYTPSRIRVSTTGELWIDAELLDVWVDLTDTSDGALLVRTVREYLLALVRYYSEDWV